MPRGPRKESPTGVYHVMTRGINRQKIFLADTDRKKYLETVKTAKETDHFELYAYCLMDTHIHMVMKVVGNGLQQSMRRINSSYAGYFNWKYDRVGHLFQNRYRSEEILTEKQLLATIRYVHNNPCKAGLVSYPLDYPWSSYHMYCEGMSPGMIEREFILGHFSDNLHEAESQFHIFSIIPDETPFLNYREKVDKEKRIDEAKTAVAATLARHNTSLERLRSRKGTRERNTILRDIMAASDVSVSDLAEILGISTHMIYRAGMQK